MMGNIGKAPISACLQSDFLKTLKRFVSTLLGTNLIWAVTGSTNHALQGVEIIPRDIDILTNKTGAYQIEGIFRDFVIKNVNYCRENTIRSYFGILCINGIQVEVIGDIENRLDNGKWEPHIDWEKHIEYLTIYGCAIPVLSLEYEVSIYQKLLKYDRVKLLQRQLKNYRKNDERRD